MKTKYMSPTCETVRLNLETTVLDDKFGNTSGVTVEQDTPGQPGDTGEGVGGFEAKHYNVWEAWDE